IAFDLVVLNLVDLNALAYSIDSIGAEVKSVESTEAIDSVYSTDIKEVVMDLVNVGSVDLVNMGSVDSVNIGLVDSMDSVNMGSVNSVNEVEMLAHSKFNNDGH
ncbi:9979_t:CDS:2, partial [Cetraspora pellucida]